MLSKPGGIANKQLTLHIRKATDTLMRVLDTSFSRTMHDMNRGLTIYIWIHTCMYMCVQVYACIIVYIRTSMHHGKCTLRDTIRLIFRSILIRMGELI